MFSRILTIAAALLATQPVYSQSINICTSAASDGDGDGFGWENNESCRVSTQSTTAPQFVNQETGQPVSLVRAHWTGPDFAEDIVCWENYFDGSSYISIDLGRLMEFEPLPLTSPYQSTVTIFQPYSGATQEVPWSLDNGIYTGPTGLGLSPWVELKDTTFDDGHVSPGVAIWTSNNAYTHCRTPNPSGSFTPSGTPSDTNDDFNGECIDTNPVGDGWGWDGTQSCQIEPLAGECIDTDGDGWGWDGVTSCRV